MLQRRLGTLPNVDVVVQARTTQVLGDGSKVTGLAYEDRLTGVGHEVALDGVFVQIGLLPNTEWLAGVVELTDRGEIVVDQAGRTSLPGCSLPGTARRRPSSRSSSHSVPGRPRP